MQAEKKAMSLNIVMPGNHKVPMHDF